MRSKKPQVHIGEMASEEEEEDEDEEEDEEEDEDIDEEEMDSGNEEDVATPPAQQAGEVDTVIPNRLLQFCQQVAEVS